MITASQESWVALGAIGGFAVALFGYLRNISRDLKGDFSTRLPAAPASTSTP